MITKAEEHQRRWEEGYKAGWENATLYAGLQATDVWQEVTVDPKGAGHTYRLRVPGGWLFRTVTYRYPELHLLMEDGYFDHDPDGRTTRHQRAMEIVAQNTVFIPEDN